MALTIGGEIRPKRVGSRSHWDDQFTRAPQPTIGYGLPIEKATLVKSATEHTHLHHFEGIDVPNLVEMQLLSPRFSGKFMAAWYSLSKMTLKTSFQY